MANPAAQLIGRHIFVLEREGNGRKVYPAIVLGITGRSWNAYGPYDGSVCLAYALPTGDLRVRDHLYLGNPVNFAGVGWFYSPDCLSEKGKALLEQDQAWPAPLVWEERPAAPESEGE